MSSTYERDVVVVGAPTKLAHHPFRLVSTDWPVFGGLVLLLYWSMSIAGLFGAILTIALSIVLLWTLNDGRRYYVTAMNLYGDYWIGGVREGVLWQKERPAGIKWWRRFLMALFIEPKPFTRRVDSLGPIGLLYHEKNRTDTILIEVDGWDARARADVDVISELEDDFSNVLRSFMRFKKLEPKVQMIRRSRPPDMGDAALESATTLLPASFYPEEAYGVLNRERGEGRDLSEDDAEAMTELNKLGLLSDDGLRMFRGYLVNVAETNEQIERLNRKTTQVFGLTFKRSARLQQAAKANAKKRKPIGEEEMAQQDIVMLANLFKRRLKALGLGNPTILNREAAEDFVREGWDADPESLEVYRDWRSEYKGGAESRYHPEECILTDGPTVLFYTTYHLTVRLTGLAAKLYPDQVQYLHEYLPVKSHVTRTLTSEVVRGTKQYIGLTAGFNLVSSLLDAIGEFIRVDHKSARKQAEIDEKSRQVDEQGHIDNFSVYISLASTDPKQLHADLTILEEYIDDIKATNEVVRSRAFSYRAAQAAMYGDAM